MSNKLTDFSYLCYWIGGSPCAGKSSVTNLLAAQFGLTTYHVDDHFNRHAQHLDPNSSACTNPLVGCKLESALDEATRATVAGSDHLL
ncbi:MAG: hypothetical protein U0175_26220 [Caldilineaceae bacterium]